MSKVKAPEDAAGKTANESPASTALTPEQAAQEFAAVEKEQNSGGR
jgi:hypothetical protein